MRTEKTLGIQFIGRNSRTEGNLIDLFLRITVNGRRAEFSLKKSIAKSRWNGDKETAKGISTESKNLNQFLEDLRTMAISKYHDLILQDKPFTVEDLKNSIIGTTQSDLSLKELIQYHQEVMVDILKPGTLKNYDTTEKYIHSFLEKVLKRKDLSVKMIDYKVILDFENFLRKHKPTDHQRPLTNNGLMKHMERFKKILNLAVNLELMERNPFDRYKFKFHRNERDFLDEGELSTLEKKLFKNQRIDLVRDLFVFSCYTGLSYIDMANLRKENLIRENNQGLWIKTHRSKTMLPVKIPVLPHAARILQKYSDDPRAESRDLLLPLISNQKLNTYLKEIADVCGIEKNLSFHVARHTFATTVTLQNGVPIESVSKMLGHNKITTTQIYARVVEVKLKEDMDNLRDRLQIKEKKNKIK